MAPRTVAETPSVTASIVAGVVGLVRAHKEAVTPAAATKAWLLADDQFFIGLLSASCDIKAVGLSCGLKRRCFAAFRALESDAARSLQRWWRHRPSNHRLEPRTAEQPQMPTGSCQVLEPQLLADCTEQAPELPERQVPEQAPEPPLQQVQEQQPPEQPVQEQQGPEPAMLEQGVEQEQLLHQVASQEPTSEEPAPEEQQAPEEQPTPEEQPSAEEQPSLQEQAQPELTEQALPEPEPVQGQHHELQAAAQESLPDPEPLSLPPVQLADLVAPEAPARPEPAVLDTGLEQEMKLLEELQQQLRLQLAGGAGSWSQPEAPQEAQVATPKMRRSEAPASAGSAATSAGAMPEDEGPLEVLWAQPSEPWTPNSQKQVASLTPGSPGSHSSEANAATPCASPARAQAGSEGAPVVPLSRPALRAQQRPPPLSSLGVDTAARPPSAGRRAAGTTASAASSPSGAEDNRTPRGADNPYRRKWNPKVAAQQRKEKEEREADAARRREEEARQRRAPAPAPATRPGSDLQEEGFMPPSLLIEAAAQVAAFPDSHVVAKPSQSEPAEDPVVVEYGSGRAGLSLAAPTDRGPEHRPGTRDPREPADRGHQAPIARDPPRDRPLAHRPEAASRPEPEAPSRWEARAEMPLPQRDPVSRSDAAALRDYEADRRNRRGADTAAPPARTVAKAKRCEDSDGLGWSQPTKAKPTNRYDDDDLGLGSLDDDGDLGSMDFSRLQQLISRGIACAEAGEEPDEDIDIAAGAGRRGGTAPPERRIRAPAAPPETKSRARESPRARWPTRAAEHEDYGSAKAELSLEAPAPRSRMANIRAAAERRAYHGKNGGGTPRHDPFEEEPEFMDHRGASDQFRDGEDGFQERRSMSAIRAIAERRAYGAKGAGGGMARSARSIEDQGGSNLRTLTPTKGAYRPAHVYGSRTEGGRGLADSLGLRYAQPPH